MIFFPHTLQLTRLCCILNHPAYEWLLKRKEKKSFCEQYIFDSMNKNKLLICSYLFFPDKMTIQVVSFFKPRYYKMINLAYDGVFDYIFVNFTDITHSDMIQINSFPCR